MSLFCLSHISSAVEIDISAAKDNTLFESPTGALSNGIGDYIFVGRTLQSDSEDQRRALLQFDVAAHIPDGSTINSAELSLILSRSRGPQSVCLHQMLSDWGEGNSDAAGPEGGGGAAMTDDATWIHAFFDAQNWNTPGGDFNATFLACTPVSTLGQQTFNSVDLTMQVQAWLDNPTTNYGIMLLGDEANIGTAQRFHSRENASGTPTLTVDYTLADLIFADSFE